MQKGPEITYCTMNISKMICNWVIRYNHDQHQCCESNYPWSEVDIPVERTGHQNTNNGIQTHQLVGKRSRVARYSQEGPELHQQLLWHSHLWGQTSWWLSSQSQQWRALSCQGGRSRWVQTAVQTQHGPDRRCFCSPRPRCPPASPQFLSHKNWSRKCIIRL